MRKDYDIVGSYNNQRYSSIDAERTVNLFEYIDPKGKRPKSLLPTSGLVSTNLNFSPELGGSRATFVFQNAFYQVFGSSVYRITGVTDNLSYVKIGQLEFTETGFVGVDANTFQVIFVDGVSGYIYDTNAGTFERITDTQFPSSPVDVTQLDGFFTVAAGGTNTFYLSSFDQGMVYSAGTADFTVDVATSILTLTTNSANFATGVPVNVTTTGALPDPLELDTLYYVIRVGTFNTNPGTIKLAASYADAIANIPITLTTAGTPVNTITVFGQVQRGAITSHPGTIVGCRTLHRRLFLFSQNFTEVWENAGIGTNLPFRRNNSLLMEYGTPSVSSISVGFDRMFFLSQDKDGLGAVMEVKGTESIPVSNQALDYRLAQYAADPLIGVADAKGFLIKENGLIFYRLNFTLANHTYVLNVSMSTPENLIWHEEEILNGDRHPAQTHAYFLGVNYIAAYDEAAIYKVDPNEMSNNGESIRRMRIAKAFSPEGYNRIRIDRFQLDLIQGRVEEVIVNAGLLLTETDNPLLTEDGLDILTEYEIIVSAGQPEVLLAISKDGGQSYGYYYNAPMGRIGQRTFRTVWRKLGTIPRGQAFVPKIEFFAQVPFVVLGAAWDFEILPE